MKPTWPSYEIWKSGWSSVVTDGPESWPGTDQGTVEAGRLDRFVENPIDQEEPRGRNPASRFFRPTARIGTGQIPAHPFVGLGCEFVESQAYEGQVTQVEAQLDDSVR